MRRWTFTLLLVGAVIAAGRSPAPGTPLDKRTTRPETNRAEIMEPWSLKAFEKEIAETVEKASDAIKACVRTVVTVVKAVARAVHAVLLTLVKVIFHIAGALLVAAGKWFLGLMLG